MSLIINGAGEGNRTLVSSYFRNGGEGLFSTRAPCQIIQENTRR
jgi:hypothetical protein